MQRENVSLIAALVHACMFSHLVVSSSFVTPWTVACQSPPSMEFPRQKQWSGLPFSTTGDLPNRGPKEASSTSERHHLRAGEGSQSQKGATVAPERHHATLVSRLHCLPRLLGIPDGRHPPGRSQPEISSPEETHGTPEKVRRLYTQKTERQGRGRQ